MPPPIVARFAVEGSIGYIRPCGRRALFSSESTTPGCDTCPALLSINLQDRVEVRGEVDDDGVVDGLAGEPGAAAPRQHWDVVFRRDVHDVLHVRRGTREDDGDGFHLIDRSVRRIEQAYVALDFDVIDAALEPGRQIVGERR